MSLATTKYRYHRNVAGLVPAAMLLLCLPATASSIAVPPDDGALQTAIAKAAPGDTLELAPGVHRGRVTIDRPLKLEGESGAIIDGEGSGSVITVAAPDVTVTGLTIQDSGDDLASRDSGVLVTKAGTNVQIENDHFAHDLFGVYLVGPEGALVSHNIITGRDDMRVAERGDGVSIWNSPHAKIIDNDISLGRDGIFVTTSHDDLFHSNHFHGVRIAVHYMYTNNSEVSANSSVGDYAGYALMYSHDLIVRGNFSQDDHDQAILLNYANDSVIENNFVDRGATQCVFIYNSNKNVFRGNRFEDCPIGIHFTAGSEGNTVTENAFIGNRVQVKYVGTRWVEWSADGRGNYWSDNPGFDLEGKGIADMPYRPNDMVDEVVWAHPLAKLLLASPALQILRLAESAFPGLHPGGVVDSAPLMQPPPEPRQWLAEGGPR